MTTPLIIALGALKRAQSKVSIERESCPTCDLDEWDYYQTAIAALSAQPEQPQPVSKEVERPNEQALQAIRSMLAYAGEPNYDTANRLAVELYERLQTIGRGAAPAQADNQTRKITLRTARAIKLKEQAK